MPPTQEVFTQPEVYTLSREELMSPPTEIEQYHVGGRVTRNNFLHFLIKSFAISRGSMQVQLLFLEWIKTKFGFDFYKTIQKLDINIYQNFSRPEKTIFEEHFNKIPVHDSFNMLEGVKNLSTAMDHDRYEIAGLYPQLALDDVKTESEFARVIHEYRSSLPERTFE